VRAVCWQGIDKLTTETVPDPVIRNDQDAILEVRLSATCGSDLHLIGGYIPAMEAGDVLGHEFLGEVVEVGPAVRKHKVGDRVVVASFIGCGRCWYCANDLWSLCDNTNTNPGIASMTYGYEPGGIFGYSHAMGGFRGSHAEFVRVPFADYGAFPVPPEVDDRSAVFTSDAVPTGWMGADLGGVRPGDVVAVWGCGAVGQMAARAAMLLGAELRERTGGRGPDVCIEAVGMEAHSSGLHHIYDQVKQQLRLESDRPTAVREAIHACRKGGTVFILGVFGGLVDKFPLGAVINKGLTVRGAQQHGQRYIPMLLDRIARGELSTSHLVTHELSLEDGAKGYDLFKHKKEGCVRAVFDPSRPAR